MLTSKLDSVTLYREGAVCRRLAQVPAASPARLLVAGLPLALDAGSVRASVLDGPVGLRVLDVRAQVNASFREEVDVPREQVALEQAQRKAQALELELSQLETEIGELQQLRPRFPPVKPGRPPREASVEALLGLASFTDARLANRLERRRALARELERAQEELALRERRVREGSSADNAERITTERVALLTLSESPSAACTVVLEYRVAAARWVPSYALRLEPGMGQGTLTMRASVAQDTGEDWRGVTLSLSTASLQRRTELPELKSLHLGRAQEPPAPSGFRAPPPGLEALFESLDATRPRPQLAGKPAPPKSAPRRRQVFASTLGEASAADESYVGGVSFDGAPGGPPPPSFGSAGGGGPRGGLGMSLPPAPPAAAPSMSMASPAPVAAVMSRSANLKSKKRTMAVSADADEMMKDRRATSDEDGSEGGAYGEPMPSEPPPPDLPANFFDYARLSLAGPENGAKRGQLLPAGVGADIVMAATATASVRIEILTVVRAVQKADSRAQQVFRLPLPAGTQRVTDVASFDYLFSCNGRLDVPSLAAWTQVVVTNAAVKLAAEYITVPSVEEKVYRTLALTNASAHALLPGPVDVSVGDQFLLTSQLPAIPPSSSTPERLGLGVEEAISVVRRTDFKENTSSFLGAGTRALVHGVEVELRNRLGSPAVVRVLERLPHPAPDERDLKIDDVSATPSWDKPTDGPEQDRFEGARQWRVTVPAGQSSKLNAHYTIRIPASRMLVDGNRRS